MLKPVSVPFAIIGPPRSLTSWVLKEACAVDGAYGIYEPCWGNVEGEERVAKFHRVFRNPDHPHAHPFVRQHPDAVMIVKESVNPAMWRALNGGETALFPSPEVAQAAAPLVLVRHPSHTFGSLRAKNLEKAWGIDIPTFIEIYRGLCEIGMQVRDLAPATRFITYEQLVRQPDLMTPVLGRWGLTGPRRALSGEDYYRKIYHEPALRASLEARAVHIHSEMHGNSGLTTNRLDADSVLTDAERGVLRTALMRPYGEFAEQARQDFPAVYA
jgi:hypothetical protein